MTNKTQNSKPNDSETTALSSKADPKGEALAESNQGEWTLKYLSNLNEYSQKQAFDVFMQCNTSENWCKNMAKSRPFLDKQSVFDAADKHWGNSTEKDLLQAFDGHPEIGDVSTLREKYRNTEKLAGHEQSGVNTANESTLQSLSQGNNDYKEKFGFIFIVCASGKSADEMLTLLLERLPNQRKQELINAAEEQRKITHIRLENLLEKEQE